MNEKGYEGMNPKYYMGLQSVSSCQPEDLVKWDKLFQGTSACEPASQFAMPAAL